MRISKILYFKKTKIFDKYNLIIIYYEIVDNILTTMIINPSNYRKQTQEGTDKDAGTKWI